MPRFKRKVNSITLDLFPFLSILACTIGTLILLIIVMAVQSVDDSSEMVILAEQETGQNQVKVPRYLECSSEGVILYPGKQLVQTSDLETSLMLKEMLLNLQANQDREYLIVVVRPDGIPTFQTLRQQVEMLGIDLGYEPLEAEWQLQFEADNTTRTP